MGYFASKNSFSSDYCIKKKKRIKIVSSAPVIQEIGS